MKKLSLVFIITVLLTLTACDVAEVVDRLNLFVSDTQCISYVEYGFVSADGAPITATVTFDHCVSYDPEQNALVFEAFENSVSNMTALYIYGDYDSYEYRTYAPGGAE